MKLNVVQNNTNLHHELSNKNIFDKSFNSALSELNLELNSQLPIDIQVKNLLNNYGYDIDDENIVPLNHRIDINEIKENARKVIREINLSTDNIEKMLYAFNDPIEKSSPHIGSIKNLISNIHSDYQTKFGQIVQSSTKYMEKINTELGKMSSYIHSGKDGKIRFEAIKFVHSLDSEVSLYSGTHYNTTANIAHGKQLIDDYFSQWQPNLESAKPIFSTIGGDKEYQFWSRKLSGYGFIIEKDRIDDKKLNIYPDLKPIKDIFSAVLNTESWHKKELHPQAFQSLQTAIDSQKNIINNNASRLLEVFRQDNNHFETLIQLLIQLLKDLQQYNNGFVNM